MYRRSEGMARRSKEDAEATRRCILDAAERVFEARGVSRASLNEIALAAGVTRGAIYWHFRDKADLFNAMMARATLPLETAAKDSDDPARLMPLQHIRDTFMEALRQTAGDPQVRRVFEIATHKVEYVGELEAVRDRHLRVRNECLAHVAQGLRLAAARGQVVGRIPARAAAIGLHALVDGLIQNWMLDQTAFDLVRAGEQILDTYLAGLTLDRGSTPAALRPART
jgi:TetR/AcrR family acrAB operon transcriptional repressor